MDFIQVTYWYLFYRPIQSENSFWREERDEGGEKHDRHVGSCHWPDGQENSIKISSRESFPTPLSLIVHHRKKFWRNLPLGGPGHHNRPVHLQCLKIHKMSSHIFTSLELHKISALINRVVIFPHWTDKKTDVGVTVGLMNSVSWEKTEPVFKLWETGRRGASEEELREDLSSPDPWI